MGIDSAEIPIGQQYPTGAIDRVYFVRLLLIAEPQRQPTAIGLLLAGQVAEGQICEANFYAGEDSLLHQQRTAGLLRLKSARDWLPGRATTSTPPLSPS